METERPNTRLGNPRVVPPVIAICHGKRVVGWLSVVVGFLRHLCRYRLEFLSPCQILIETRWIVAVGTNYAHMRIDLGSVLLRQLARLFVSKCNDALCCLQLVVDLRPNSVDVKTVRHRYTL